MKLLVLLLSFSFLINAYFIAIHFGKITDDDKDLIPDELEVKAKKIKADVKHKAKRVKEELADVKDSLKEVVNQIDDLPKAIKGETRTGRKQK
jgi:F0F1-type ATP synthase membrane subunit b/b'